MRPSDVPVLCCPDCRAALVWSGREVAGRMDAGLLSCAGCRTSWIVSEGLPRLFREERVTGTDWLMRLIYDVGARLHDPAVHYLLPLVEGEGSEATLRDAYMRRLDLASLKPRRAGPVRILEVGVGGGANLPLIRRDLPPGLDVEVWGADLSAGMLSECARRVRDPRLGLGEVRLLMADAHALPFPDASFDRVFHVGGIGGFRDPGRALAEMARVAVPGSPIVVVDEQLDPKLRRSPVRRALFGLMTFYERDPHSPREKLPQGAGGIIDEQISPFCYCLTYKVPRALGPRH
ncbi:MAG: class I SAM-dependent methyltransferase [Deltaproteobacteria bacterium]|nr:class I SAM-dependent methyltransferase [Deltaproteobacteria bacterium]